MMRTIPMRALAHDISTPGFRVRGRGSQPLARAGGGGRKEGSEKQGPPHPFSACGRVFYYGHRSSDTCISLSTIGGSQVEGGRKTSQVTHSSGLLKIVSMGLK